MTDIRDEAIVLHTSDLGEADLLVSFLSKGHGKQRGVAKNAKKSKRRFPNCLSLGNRIELLYQCRPNRELCFLLEARLIEPLSYVGESYQKALLASYALKITHLFLPPSQRETEIFELLKYILKKDPHLDPNALCLYFESRFSKFLGYAINLKECLICRRPYRFEGTGWYSAKKGGILCPRCRPKGGVIPIGPEEARLLELLQEGENFHPLGFDEEMLHNLSKILLTHMESHLGDLPRSILLLRERFWQ
ncbi:MAG: DNA repair protein RecO [Desulfatiglandales bacterium]